VASEPFNEHNATTVINGSHQSIGVPFDIKHYPVRPDDAGVSVIILHIVGPLPFGLPDLLEPSVQSGLYRPMMEKLLAMRLQGVVEVLKTQEQDRAINEHSFLKRIALLVDQQWTWRENQALARRLKAAKLRGPACVEDIDYRAARGLDKTVMRALAKDSSWVRNHENIFVLGPTGLGKSFIASALAPLNENERREVWEICEDRYQTRSTILTSQLPISRWHEQIGDPTIADGILDRLVHNAHRIEMRGESMRKKRNPQQDEKKE